MPITTEVSVKLAILGIAAGFGAGIFTGRSVGQMVEEDIARVAAASARASLPRVAREGDRQAQPVDVARFKIAVTHAQPVAGPSDALVTIVEWCDLYGAACRRTDALVRDIVERYPREVRRAFRSPGGSSHGAVSRAEEQVLEVALAVHEQGKFWELRERLMEHDSAPDLAELRQHAHAIGTEWAALERALERRTYAAAIASDRALARSLDVRVAPAVHVNGRPLEGELTAASLSALVDDEIARARLMVNDGASRERIYAEIIKPAEFGSVHSSL